MLSRQEYTCVRDYLMTEIEIISCQRSEVPANITIDEVKNAVFKENKFIIKVRKHKTFRKHGSAHLCCSSKPYN